MENKMVFTDRDPTYPNRRKIKILQQQGNEIIADIELHDSPKNNKTGTPINASTFNQFQEQIEDSYNFASEANDIINNLSVSSVTLDAGLSPSVDIETASNKRKNIKFSIPNAKTGTSMKMKGIWNSTTTYVNNEDFIDVVTLNGCCYYCKITNTNNIPIDNGDSPYWGLLAAHGNNASVTIVDNLESNNASYTLSANQGRVLKESLDNEIATRTSANSTLQNSISNLNNEVVKLTENQNISGTKTFSSSPKVPTPSLTDNSTTTANTAWVNDKLEKMTTLPIGSIITSAIPLTDASVHLLDGGTISQSGIYSEFTTYLKSQISSGCNITCSQNEFENDVLIYGQCGKFVVDDSTGTIRLPKITEFIASSNGGQQIGIAQLDSFKSHSHTISRYTGTDDNNFSGHKTNGIAANDSETLSAANTSYVGENETKPKNIRYPYYIILANSYKTDVQVNIDNVSSEINNKADKTLSNVTYPTNIIGGTSTGSGDRVVESYISTDGGTWYRKWASGWKECGVIISTPSGSTSGYYYDYTVSLPIEFTNTNYAVSTVSVSGYIKGNISDTAWLSAQSNLVVQKNSDNVHIMALYNKKISIYCCGF